MLHCSYFVSGILQLVGCHIWGNNVLVTTVLSVSFLFCLVLFYSLSLCSFYWNNLIFCQPQLLLSLLCEVVFRCVSLWHAVKWNSKKKCSNLLKIAVVFLAFDPDWDAAPCGRQSNVQKVVGKLSLAAFRLYVWWTLFPAFGQMCGFLLWICCTPPQLLVWGQTPSDVSNLLPEEHCLTFVDRMDICTSGNLSCIHPYCKWKVVIPLNGTSL